jgi:hypothetical protein
MLNEIGAIVAIVGGLNAMVLLPVFKFVLSVNNRLTRIEAKLNIPL